LLDEAAKRRKNISNQCITPSGTQFRAPSKQREVYHESERNESI
jgi:hypothetical protein